MCARRILKCERCATASRWRVVGHPGTTVSQRSGCTRTGVLCAYAPVSSWAQQAVTEWRWRVWWIRSQVPWWCGERDALHPHAPSSVWAKGATRSEHRIRVAGFLQRATKHASRSISDKFHPWTVRVRVLRDSPQFRSCHFDSILGKTFMEFWGFFILSFLPFCKVRIMVHSGAA
jgi:hypothetical protein